MRAVITRVKSASVSIAGSVVGEIGHGLLILLGVGRTIRRSCAKSWPTRHSACAFSAMRRGK